MGKLHMPKKSRLMFCSASIDASCWLKSSDNKNSLTYTTYLTYMLNIPWMDLWDVWRHRYEQIIGMSGYKLWRSYWYILINSTTKAYIMSIRSFWSSRQMHDWKTLRNLRILWFRYRLWKTEVPSKIIEIKKKRNKLSQKRRNGEKSIRQTEVQENKGFLSKTRTYTPPKMQDKHPIFLWF